MERIGIVQPAYVLTLGLLVVVAGASVLYFAIERPAKAWLRAAAAGFRAPRGAPPRPALPEPASPGD